MYPVSADFHNLSIADAPTSRVRIYFIEANVDCTDDNDVHSNGTLLCMPGETDSNGRIEKGGVTINEFFNSDTNVQIGATVSSQIGMTLINRDGALDGFNYGRCKVYIDVYDDTNSTWLTCPMGVYNIAIPKRRKVQLVSATGYDQMQQLDEIADSWWNGLDWSNGITLLQIIQSMAETLGIHLSANTSANIVNSGLSYTEIPFTAIEMTYRDILSYIAETTGTIARFDRNGALDLRWFSDAVLSTDTQTYAGGLVTFTATDRASISSLSVPFSPIQDLHGYSHPWPAGGGKNKYNGADIIFNADASATTLNGITLTKNSDGSFTVVGTATAETRLNTRAAYDFKAGKSYTISVRGLTNGNIRIIINGNVSGFGLYYTSEYPTHDFSRTYTIRGDCGFAYFFIDVQNGATVNNTVRVQIEEGQLTDWTPYSNICPISGRAGVNVYRTGKNWYSGGNVTVTNALFTNVAIDPIPAGTYTVSAVIGTAVTTARVAFRKQNSSALEAVNIPYVSGGRSYATITLPDTAYRIYFYYAGSTSGTGNQTYTDVQIELGSTATTYEPYNGNTYSVDWTTQAGTVYHGTVDPVAGQLTVDSVKYATTWGNYSGSTTLNACVRRTFTSPDKSKYPNYAWTPVSNILQYSADFSGDYPHFYVNSSTANNVIVTLPAGTSDDTSIEVVYELATPVTYQLTPIQVAVLAGTNNVWSTGDSVSVTVSEPTLVEIQTDTVGNQCLSIDVGEYQVSQIDALSVKASQADVGVTIGSGGNAYTILDNPMLFGDEAAITTKATPIYNRLSAFRLFTPISMRCIMDWSIEAGDIITVTNESVTYDLPIFQQRLRWRGGYVVSDLFSNGEQERPTQSKEIRSSFRSNTQMHEFEVTLEQLRSYIQSVDGNYTLIQQTVDAITQTVANQNVTIQNILDPTGEIWTAITKNTSNLSSIEDSLNNEITERRSYIRLIPSEPAIVMGVDEDNEIKLKLVNNIIYFFNGADDSTDLSLAYAYFNSQEAFADRFVAGESVQIGTNDNAAHWLWKKLNNGDLVLELVG